MDGVVRSAQILTQNGFPRLVLSLDLGQDNIVGVRLLTFSPSSPAMLEGATVRLRAICASAFNTRRQFIGPRLFATGMADIRVEHPPAARPFDAPLVPLSQLLRFSADSAPVQRTHVQGIVTCVRSGGFCMQEGEHGAFVETDHVSSLRVGESVQVIGYPKAGSYSPTIANASVQQAPVPSAALPVPTVSSDKLLAQLDAYVTAPFDGLLIRVSGKLLDTIPGSDEDLLLIDSSGVLISARLPVDHGVHSPLPHTGAVLALTGVSSALTNDLHEAHGSALLLRSAADVQVLRPAPWWNGTRAWWAIVLLALAVLGLLAWAAFMRRQTNLRDLVARDSLTGLYNRRGFLLMAERQWNHALRQHRQMLLFYLDLDQFKCINDTHGHQAGDLALKTAADILRGCCRKSDIIGRLGGDEFAIATMDSPEMQEGSVRQRLRLALREANDRQGNAWRLNFSIGVLPCDVALGPLPIEDLLSRADMLMYEQKRGRKASVFQAPVPPRPVDHPLILAKQL